MKIKLMVRKVKKSRQEGVSQQIKIHNLKDEKVRREYQAVITELFVEACAREHTYIGKGCGIGVEGVEGRYCGAAMKVCGTTRRRGETKRMRWWNEEVKCAVRKKKMMYRRLLDTGTEEAKKLYKDVKLEAKTVVRNAKNEGRLKG